MSWFKYSGKGFVLPWKEWRGARKDPNDITLMYPLSLGCTKKSHRPRPHLQGRAK